MQANITTKTLFSSELYESRTNLKILCKTLLIIVAIPVTKSQYVVLCKYVFATSILDDVHI